MPYLRLQIDLAIPLPLWQALPDTPKHRLKAQIASLLNIATTINPNQPDEEDTTRAVYHICRHDTGDPCDPETPLLSII